MPEYTRTDKFYAVEMYNKGEAWIELPGFRKTNKAGAIAGAKQIHNCPDPARVVKVEVTTTIVEEVVWQGATNV